jgi:hypothetical protein
MIIYAIHVPEFLVNQRTEVYGVGTSIVLTTQTASNFERTCHRSFSYELKPSVVAGKADDTGYDCHPTPSSSVVVYNRKNG